MPHFTAEKVKKMLAGPVEPWPPRAPSAPALSESAGSLPVVGSGGVVGLRVESAEALLDRADEMLRRADLLLDGWQHARDWCNDLIDYRRQMEVATMRQPEPNDRGDT